MVERRVKVVVLTCSDLGYETAEHLASLPEVEEVHVVEAPPLRPRTLKGRVRKALRHFGFWGLIAEAGRRLVPGREAVTSETRACTVPLRRVDSFHSSEGLSVIAELAPDVAVVDGTYILKESVFTLPEITTINLHCGYLPDFKGSPPVFWELMHGERSVGVSVHHVTADLDGGPIISRRRFPIDPTPPGDPMEYAREVWRTVLRPAGIEMLGVAIQQAAAGTLGGTPQDGSGRTFRYPGHAQVKELRRVVSDRREER